MAMSISVAMVQSLLDYANSLLYNTSAYNINRLQRVQNMITRLVLRNRQIASADSLSQLHWLPVSKRIDFKITTHTNTLISTEQPGYFRSLISYETRSYIIRTTEKHQPIFHTVTGVFDFSSASRAVYNAISLEIRFAQSVDLFRRQLKLQLSVSLTLPIPSPNDCPCL